MIIHADVAALSAFPQRPEDRLRLAVRRLETALAEQTEAVAAYREGIGRLGDAIAQLDQGVAKYRGAVDGVMAEVAGAQASARRLQRAVASLPG